MRLDAWLVIGVPFDFHFDGAVLRLDAEHPVTLEPAWRLLRRRIVSASADTDLNLNVGFDKATRSPSSEATCTRHGNSTGRALAAYLPVPVDVLPRPSADAPGAPVSDADALGGPGGAGPERRT